MTLEQNITAILETYFSGFRSELIEACAKRIMEQIEGQADTPQTDRPCDKCEWHKEYGRCIFEYCHYEYEQAHKDTPQMDCETCRYGQDKHRYTHICNECGVGINNYTPQTESDGE